MKAATCWFVPLSTDLAADRPSLMPSLTLLERNSEIQKQPNVFKSEDGDKMDYLFESDGSWASDGAMF